MNFYSDIDKYENRIAIVTAEGEEVSYRQFIADGQTLFADVPARTLIFIVCENCLESVCAYIGALRKRVVPVMVNAGIDSELFQKLYLTYQPRYIFMPQAWNPAIADTCDKVQAYRNYELYQTDCKQEYEIYPELALLLTTSGSTGSPKLVRQSYENITANANSIAEYLDIRMEDRAITTMPMSYTYCLSIINSHLLRGACIIMNEFSIIQRQFWDLFREQKPTTFGGVPYIYQQLKALRFSRMDVSSLRYITQAGGKLSKEMAEEFNGICEEKGIQLIVMYGQTEATARMSYLPWEWSKKKAGSMGIAIPGGKFRLIDVEGKDIEAADTVGELVYEGANVTLGYAENREDLKKEDENKGVLYTGDMAKRDADGFYYIVGRKKRFLKLYGNRVNLDEVEGLLQKEGFNCVCAGVDEHMKIYTTEPDTEKHKEILQYLSHTLGFVQKSFEVIYISEIPRNEAGKVLYSALGNE